MSDGELSGVRPSYLPAGFSLISSWVGSDDQGFRDVEDQLILRYVSSGKFIYPLLVAIADTPGETLFGTEEMPGTPIAIAIAGVKAEYHDGIWAAGDGDVSRPAGTAVVHWQTGGCHSVTVTTPTRTIAVRGSTTTGVDMNELLMVARSLPLD
jgi:hypothetical protein